MSKEVRETYEAEHKVTKILYYPVLKTYEGPPVILRLCIDGEWVDESVDDYILRRRDD